MRKTLSLLLAALLCLTLLPAIASAADFTDTYENTLFGVDGASYHEDHANSSLDIYISGLSNSRTNDGFAIARNTDNGKTTTRFSSKNGYSIKEIRFTPNVINYKSPLVVKTSTGVTTQITEIKVDTPIILKNLNAGTVDFSTEGGWFYTPEYTLVLGMGSTVTVTATEGGTAEASATFAERGTRITLTATPDDGYRFKEWQSEQVTVKSDNTFTMPGTAVTVKAVFEKYNNPVTVTDDGNGTASADKTEAAAGETVTLTAAPKDGYRFKEWQSGQVTVASDDTFIMPKEAVTVKAVFEKTPIPAPVVTPKTATVEEGQRVTFTASAEGTELTYQWYVDRNDGSGWTKLNGATSAAYTTGAVTMGNDGYKYKCSVSGVDSNEAELRVTFTPAPVPPKTGDGSMPLLWIFLLSVSLMGVQALRKKSER